MSDSATTLNSSFIRRATARPNSLTLGRRRDLPRASSFGGRAFARSRRRPLGPWAVALLLFLGPFLSLGATGSAQAGPAQAPNLEGAYIIGNGTALAIVGYVGWANVWTSAPNGTQIYSQAAYLSFFNLRNYNETVHVDVRQSTGYVDNISVALGAISESDITLNLPNNPSWTQTTLYFNGVPYWQGQFATPVSLFPSYIGNIGGLDLFALGIVSFMVINVVGGFTLGRWAMRRAIWAPRFSLLIWGHVIIVAIAGAVLLDYQQIDATFAGWSPLLYPWATFPMSFLTSLSYFNRSQQIQIEQGVVTTEGGLGVRLTNVRVGRLADGRLAFVGGSWGDFWARFWRHYAICDDAKDGTPRPLLVPVSTMPSPTAGARSRSRMRKLARLRRPSVSEALTNFPVVNPTTDIAFKAFAKTSEPVVIGFPRLSIHKTVTLPPKIATLPTSQGGTSTVVIPERTVRKLTWPHYVASPIDTRVELEDRHYWPAAAVWANFATTRDMGRQLSKESARVATLEAHIEERVQDELYSKLRNIAALRNRASSGISEEEAAATVGQLDLLLSSKNAAKKVSE
jgi:hypothetical protein